MLAYCIEHDENYQKVENDVLGTTLVRGWFVGDEEISVELQASLECEDEHPKSARFLLFQNSLI